MEFVIADVTIIDGTGRDPIARGALHVVDGRVGWVGPQSDLPRELRRVPVADHAGQTVVPGLIDAHIHLCWSGAESIPDAMTRPRDQLLLEAVVTARNVLASGTTAVRDVGGQDYLEMALRWGIDAGHVPGPRMRTSGKFITMTGGHAHFVGREADGVDDIRKAVREQVKAGADNIKLMATGGVATAGQDVQGTQLDVTEMAAAVEIAHTAARTVAAHCHGTVGIKNAVRAGVDSIEHGSYLDEEAADMMRGRGTALVLTLGLSHPRERSIAPTAQSEADRIRAHLPKMREALRATVALARRTRMLVGLGSDAGGNPLVPHDFNMAHELEELVALGYPPIEAITVATRDNARILRMDTETGTLERGKLADFVVLGGDPLADISNVRAVRAVYTSGVRAPDVTRASSTLR